jgi:hypothetical protein
MSPSRTPIGQIRSPLPWGWLGLVSLAGALALLLLLKAMPYSSVRLGPVEASETTAAPTPDFAMGPLQWRVGALAASPSLEPFRTAMRAACADARGLRAAACATRVLRERFPDGAPSDEFVTTGFDPVTHFARHMSGEPGHCLTRSAILATELLSVGIPARVVQMVPARVKGHTLVEVWDEELGWTVVDPSTNGYVTARGGTAAAADLLMDPARVEWRPFDTASATDAEAREHGRYFETLLTGNILYPEPWLYLREGDRVASWPLRGHYARVGPPYLTLGPAQLALGWGALTLAVLGAMLLLLAWQQRSATARTLKLGETTEALGLDAVPRV